MRGRQHPDEINAIETSAQTEHKLEIMRRYFPKYAATIANFGKIRDIWLIDLFAGTGLHRSVDHPDGQRDGTALLACTHAWKVQRQFPRARLHVRLVDVEHDYCVKLEERTQWLREVPTEEQIDLRIMPMDFAKAIPIICAEIRARGATARSLWFVDPYKPTPMRYETLAPILLLPHSEIIINLDVTGIIRMRGQVLSHKAQQSVPASVTQSEQHLNDIFHSNHWREPERYIRSLPSITEHKRIALLYAEQFRTFRYHDQYALDASDNQFRYLVQLCRSEAGFNAFRECYMSSHRRGLYKGRTLDESDCAKHAETLMHIYYGRMTALDDVYASEVLPLDRAQVRRVLQYAEGHGYGRLTNDIMQWNSRREARVKLTPGQRLNNEQTSLFDSHGDPGERQQQN